MFEAWFVDRHDAVEQPLDLVLIDVYARDIDAELGETCSSDESDITSTDNRNMHLKALPGERWESKRLLGKILRATRSYRVTRKVNSTDRSAGSQCHSIFLVKPNELGTT